MCGWNHDLGCGPAPCKVRLCIDPLSLSWSPFGFWNDHCQQRLLCSPTDPISQFHFSSSLSLCQLILEFLYPTIPALSVDAKPVSELVCCWAQCHLDEVLYATSLWVRVQKLVQGFCFHFWIVTNFTKTLNQGCLCVGQNVSWPFFFHRRWRKQQSPEDSFPHTLCRRPKSKTFFCSNLLLLTGLVPGRCTDRFSKKALAFSDLSFFFFPPFEHRCHEKSSSISVRCIWRWRYSLFWSDTKGVTCWAVCLCHAVFWRKLWCSSYQLLL